MIRSRIIPNEKTTSAEPSARIGWLAKWRRPSSLRRQVVLGNVLVLLVIVATLCLLVYWLVSERLFNELDRHLEVQSAEMQASANAWGAAGQSFNSAFYERLLQKPPSTDIAGEPTYIKITDKYTGETLAQSPEMRRLHITFRRNEVDRVLLNGQSVFSTYREDSSKPLRTLAYPLRYDNQVLAVVYLNQSLETLDRVQIVLATVLVLGSLLAGLLVYAVGVWLTARKLQPLSNLVATMQHFDEQNLKLRLPVQSPASPEIQHITQAFNSMLDRLEKAFTLQRSFVAEVSHELRTPLTTMRGQLDVLLLDPELNALTRSDVQHVNAELARLSRLVANLLTNARVEIGILPRPHQTARSLVELDSLLVSIARQAKFLNERVILQITHLEQISVPGESDLLKQVLLNLLDNAQTYTPAGGNINLQLKRAEGDWAVISVSDGGPGIAPDDLPHIFERGYRNTASSNNFQSGAGLGLYIARLITEAHDGRIEVCSQPGQGACFEVWLPIKPIATPAAFPAPTHARL